MSTSARLCSVCGEKIWPDVPVIFHDGEAVHLTCYLIKAAERVQSDSQGPEARML
jgi:hypothetical protein